MLDLVNDLLDVAKLEAGKFDVDKQVVNIKDILAERARFFDATARDSGVDLKVFIDADTPSGVRADPKRISQVINNLLSNAINYTPKGGKVTAICFMHKKGEIITDEAVRLAIPWAIDNMPTDTDVVSDSVVVAVSDSGEGISAENIQKLFNKFTQFASNVRRDSSNKGTGLGLVIVKGVVDAHGGTIGVGSKVGVGSTFYFTLPL